VIQHLKEQPAGVCEGTPLKADEMPDQPTSKTSRKRLRMSVRALMMSVLVLGGGLGWIVHEAQVQREAVAAIRKRAGGNALYDWQLVDDEIVRSRGSWWPRWIMNRVGPDYLSSVGYVYSDPR
jgi:hypothetical protein